MLKCKADGAAPLKYTWLKDGMILRGRTLDPYLNTSIWYLELKDLVPGDAGEYTCIVSNPYGSINHTYSVRVQGEYRRGWVNSYPLFVKSFHLGIGLTLVIFPVWHAIMAAGHVFRGWSILLFWWGCLAILYSNNSKSNSWNDLVAVVKDKYWLSVTGPGVVPSIIQFRHQRRKQRGSLYLYTRVSYDVNGTSTFHVSRLPLCGDVAINLGPLKPKAPKYSCKECSETIRRNQDAGRHLACRMQWLVSRPSESACTCSKLVSSGYSCNQASTLDLWAVFFAKDNCRMLSAKFLRWFRLLWLKQSKRNVERVWYRVAETPHRPILTLVMSRLDMSTLTS